MVCEGSTSIKKYLPLQRGGLLPQPVRHDTCWLPDLPQITMMLSHWASVNYNIHWLYQTHRQIPNIHNHGHMHKIPHAAAMLNSFSGAEVQQQGLIPLLRRPVGVMIFIYIYFPNLLPLPLFKETRLDIQVFYSICGSDHPSSRSITLPAAFINDLVSQPALGCSRLSRMIDH